MEIIKHISANVKIAPRIGSDPITPYELAEYIQIAGPKEAEIITTLARAKAELAFGNRLAACPLIAEAMRKRPANLVSWIIQ